MELVFSEGLVVLAILCARVRAELARAARAEGPLARGDAASSR